MAAVQFSSNSRREAYYPRLRTAVGKYLALELLGGATLWHQPDFVTNILIVTKRKLILGKSCKNNKLNQIFS